VAESPQERAARQFQERLTKAQKASGGAKSSDAQASAAEEFQRRMKARGVQGSGASSGGAPSLVSQAKHAFAAVPRGLLSLGGAAVTDVKHTVAPWTSPGRREGEDFVEYMARTRPLTGGVIQSVARTADKFGEVAAVPFGKSGWKDTTYAREIEEGRILASAIEDVANVALLGGVAGRVAGTTAAHTSGRVAAAAGKVEKAAGNLKHLGGDVASLPARPYLLGAKALGTAAKKSGVGPALAGIPVTRGLTERLETKGKIPASIVGEDGRATIGQIASQAIERRTQARRYRQEALDPFAGEVLSDVRRIEKLVTRADKILPDTDAQTAVLLAHTGQGEIARIARSLEGEARDAFIREQWGVEHAPSPRVLDYVVGYVDDTLPPSVRDGMDAAYPLLQRVQQEITEPKRLAGEGGDPLNPEQLGDQPMEAAIALDPELTRLRTQVGRTERLLEGDKNAPGLRSRVARQRAAVGTPDLAGAVPQQAVGRVQRAAGTEAEAALLRQQAERQRATAVTARDQAADLASRPFPAADPRLLRDVERQAVRVESATTAQRAASAEARVARGEIGQKVSAEERRLVAAQRAEAKAEAAREFDDLAGEYDRITGGGERLRTPPPRKRVGTDPITRKPIYARGGGGEWDWWDQLSRTEQARLVRNGWIARERGIVPDEMADFVSRSSGDEAVGGGARMQGGTSEAMERWVDLTRRIDDARGRTRTGGTSRAEAFETLRERGPRNTFDEPGYDAAQWATDYSTVVSTIRTARKGTPEYEDAARLYRDIVPEGLHEAAAGRSFSEAFEVARGLAAQRGERRFSPEGRLSAAEQKVAAAVDRKSARGLSAAERSLYQAVQSALRGEAADTALIGARGQAVERVVASVAPALRKQGAQIGRAEGRARTLTGEASLADFMARTRERRLEGVDPQADLVAGMGVAQRRLAPQIRREERATVAERQVALVERRLDRLRKSAAAREAWLREGRIDPVKRADAVPGRYATPLLNAATARRALNQMADELDAATEGSTMGAHLRAMADDLPETMAQVQRQMENHGIDLDYVIGGPVERLGGAARIRGGTLSTPIERKLSSARQKATGRVPLTFKQAGRLYAESVSQIVENKSAAFVAQNFAQDARRILTDAGEDAAEIERLVTRGGEDLAKRMEREGWTAWSPKGRPPGMDSHKADTTYLPSVLERQYRHYWSKPSRGGLYDIVDVPTRTWKHMVLALNPMWNIGNAVSATLLATGAGGLTPRELVRFGREASAALRRESASGTLELPARLHGAGQAGEMLRGFRDPVRERSLLPERIGGRRTPGGGKQIPDAVRHPINAAYQLNQFVDDWARSTVYLAKKAKGLNDETAVRLALRAMGDFANMTPLERNVIRRIYPFYAWSRHVTQLAAHLAVEHPVRVAWMMNLGANYGGGADDAVADVPSFLAGALHVPDSGPLAAWSNALLGESDTQRFLSVRSLNPYGDIATSPFSSPKEFARGTNPMLKLAAFIAGGNLGKWRDVTRPPGTTRRSEYGGEEWTASDAGAVLYWLSQQTAPTRAAHAALADPVVRYDTGDPMRLKGAEIPMEGGRREAVIRNTGIPFVPTTFDEERQKARVAAQRRRDERSRRRYEGGR
jgi:hypothetical protein